MKKFTILFALMFTWGFAMSQTIENFESLTMTLFSGGTNGSLSVVPNPDPTGINTSGHVVKMVRGFNGDPWAGWYATLPTPIDVTANKYVHLKVWKPRISPVVFKYEGEVNSGDVSPINPQTTVNQWEELVFDMSVVSGDYVKIVLIPDFENPLTLTEDIVLYFDDLYANNDPTVGSAPVQIMEDYEFITMNYMGNANPPDESSFEIVPNPDQSGLNLSETVVKFTRDKDGVPWGGFFSQLPEPIDVTTNKYMHVKVWKPRISPIKFKIEGGEAGNLETASISPQEKVNEWEDIVFDLSSKTGTYPTIVFMPDFEDPLTLTEDIVIYFDDIILNNDPNPMTGLPELTINVDMSEAGTVDRVFLSGALGGIYGTWAEPGSNPNNEMFDSDGDKIYSITIKHEYAPVEFKFFKGTGWGGGDPVQSPGLDQGNRKYDFTEPASITYKWGVAGLLLVPENMLATQVKMYPNPVSNELIINSSNIVKEVTITSMLGKMIYTGQLNKNGDTVINTGELSSGLYFVTFYGNDGSRAVQKLVKQ
ncbi:MAG: T9SS type A sorting domain-containing protein [Lentimicrobiaceae bacterium]|nr:T9SS type A sorting domain-containing protein [Lentimicrobiaceae bacterium]